MSLLTSIDQEIKKAMLAKDSERLGTLRLVKSALGYAQMERPQESLTDAEVLALLQKEIKKRREAISQYDKGGRPELAAKEKAEIAIIEEFLPEPLSPAELEALIQATLTETGASGRKDMGKVIKAVQEKAAGRADGKTISGLVAKLLQPH